MRYRNKYVSIGLTVFFISTFIGTELAFSDELVSMSVARKTDCGESKGNKQICVTPIEIEFCDVPKSDHKLVITSLPNHCSDVSYQVELDGVQLSSGFLEPGQSYPLQSDPPLVIGPPSNDKYNFTVIATGRDGGCNTLDKLTRWGVELSISPSQ